MKFKQNWKSWRYQLDKLSIRLRISAIDFFSIEIDVNRNFYMLSILNFTFKNR